MQNDAAHVRVVEIQYMAHLTVGQRCIQSPELEISAEHGSLRPATHPLQHCEERVDGPVPAASERAANPVEYTAPSLALRRRRKIGEPCRREMPAQRLGEG